MSYFLNNDYLLNPIKSQKDGLAEILYNISSWYYQKNLLKYSIFFGKLSLRIRPNFNAMKLLVANALEEIGYEQLAIELISNVNKRNLYFMKFIKLKNSLQENSLFEKQLLNELKNLSKTFPKKHSKTNVFHHLRTDVAKPKRFCTPRCTPRPPAADQCRRPEHARRRGPQRGTRRSARGRRPTGRRRSWPSSRGPWRRRRP